jgi:hypothetical protein
MNNEGWGVKRPPHSAAVLQFAGGKSPERSGCRGWRVEKVVAPGCRQPVLPEAINRAAGRYSPTKQAGLYSGD